MSRTSAPLLERHPGEADLLGLAAASPGFAQLHTVRGWTVALCDPLDVVTDLAELSAAASRLGWRAPRDPALPPFTAGLAGFLTDTLSAGLLDLAEPAGRPAPAPLPPLAFGLYDTAVLRDPDGEVWLAAGELPGYSTVPAAQRLAGLRERVARAAPPPDGAAAPPPARVTASLSRDGHAKAVRQAQEWIAAGDLYQLNLTLQLRAPWGLGGAALARRLWQATPGAAHAAWLRAPGGTEVVSASPETFLRVDGDRAVVRPIKGTRPRHADPRRDHAERLALEASVKDRAEHVMIVDLERNDLGRVAVAGGVTVEALAATEALPTLWHLVSTVSARLRPEVSLEDLLAAAFPCGSVTGAPKRMAVARIGALEPVQRGVYCGATGVIGPGLVDLSVAIRTAVVHDGQASYGTGGGIVADSDPDAEWQEVLHKAEAFFSAANARLP
ncbi:MAG TPA: anthranilate synthase component I family protein [Egibacteraceae bacterium]|nr:anthranilate synthase component I family protein [Egibacteraceae bacterium]